MSSQNYPLALTDGQTILERALWQCSAVLLSAAGAGLIWLAGGNWAVVPGLVAALVYLVLLTRYLQLGVYTLLAAAIVVEQFQISGIDDILTLKIPLYLNLNLITGIGPLVFNPVELLIGVIGLIWFVRAATSRQWRLRPIPGGGVALLFGAMLAAFVVFGLARGGVFTVALWEVRALFYLLAMFFISAQVLHSRRHVAVCLWIIVIGLAVKGLQGSWRFFIDLGARIGDVPAITGHEDALFMTTGFILLLTRFLLGHRDRLFWVLLATTPPVFLTFLLTQRRVAYGTLLMSSLIVFAFMPRRGKMLALKCAAPLAVLGVLYAAVFWNSASTIALPIQQVKSVFAKGEAADSSNTYRDIENFNLEQTIRAFPGGVGFGKKYLVIIPLAEVDFPLWDYIPHNCIYWMWAKTGWGGFIVFWLFFASLLVRQAIDARAVGDPWIKAVILMVMAFVFSQVVVANYDLQITFYRNMLYLGTALGMWTQLREDAGLTDAPGPAEKRG
jgi:hypothetical protein